MGRAGFDSNNIHTLIGLSSDGSRTPIELYANPSTNALLVQTSGLIGGVNYDYIDYKNTSTTVDTYVYKTGGSGGTIIKTVTITYTDTTKNQVSNVAYT